MRTRTPIDALLKHLGAGATGVLSVDLPEAPVRVHLANGEIVAATTDRDAIDVLHRLVRAGLLDAGAAGAVEASLAQGGGMADLLQGSLPPETVLARLGARFEENLARFLLARGPARFESRPADGEPHPRLGADPADLIVRTRALAQRARGLLEAPATRRLAPGPTPSSRQDAALLGLVGDGTAIGEVLDASPDQPVATAARLSDLLDREVLVALDEEIRTPVVDEVGDVTDPSLVEESVERRFQIEGDRPAGAGEFVVQKHLLDYVDLESGSVERPPDSEDDIVLEMEEGDDSKTARTGAVTLALGGPTLSTEEARRKVEVINEVLRVVAGEFQGTEGPGAGRARIQSLLQGAPTRFQTLFRNVAARKDGSLDTDVLVQNVQQRPEGERRRVLNGALQDLVERTLTLAAEILAGDRLDGMLDRVAGYQKRLGL